MSKRNENRSIIIGCDEITTLSLILNTINTEKFKSYSIITVSRTSDLITSVKRGEPTLVILSFRFNHEVLRDLYNFTRQENLVTFCFTSLYETKGIDWNSDHSIFTYPLDLAMRENSIGGRISSVLSMAQKFQNKSNNNYSPSYHNIAGSDQDRSLSRYVLELDQKRVVLENITNRIKEIYPHATDEVRKQLLSVVNSIKSSNQNHNYWEDFKKYFEGINPEFLRTLSKKHPSLTPKDLKYCCYLKMNMSNNDITGLLGINQESVRTHKYRLKKKMSLSKSQNIEGYLKAFKSPNEKVA